MRININLYKIGDEIYLVSIRHPTEKIKKAKVVDKNHHSITVQLKDGEELVFPDCTSEYLPCTSEWDAIKLKKIFDKW